ncbi:MAG TPA: hypothetical protein VGH11_02830 [Jatrophihabitans sp.]|jgi:hypothetical protein
MRSTFRALAGLIALGVVVQAASIAYAAFALAHAVDDGTTIDKNSKVGDAGFAIHGINGQMVIPLLAILLFAVSSRAQVPQGVKWAGIVLLTTAVQVGLGFASHSLPVLGWLHGIIALALFAVAGYTARLAALATRAAQPPPLVDSQG